MTDVEVWDFETKSAPKTSANDSDQPMDDNMSCRPIGATNEDKRHSNVLFIKDYKSLNDSDNCLCFANHRKIGSFGIDGNQRYHDLNCVQNVIKDGIDFENICKMNINLMDGFENSSLITDYKSYKLLKWKYFLKWINRSQCLQSSSSDALPQFVSFGGLFTSLLMTPNRIENWTLLVTKFKDTIFMNKIRLNDGFNRFDGKRVEPTVTQRPTAVDRNPFFAAKVTQIVSHSSGESLDPIINEFEKHFECYETQIGDHRLLLMSEMDAIDEDGNQYEIKCAKNLFYGQKLLNWWSNCVVSDIDCILIGVKDNNEMLKQIHRLRVEDIPEMREFHWRPKESFDFVNRILHYIKDLLKSVEDLQTFKVFFRKSDRCVRSAKQPFNGLLPKWFTSGEQSDDEDVSDV